RVCANYILRQLYFTVSSGATVGQHLVAALGLPRLRMIRLEYRNVTMRFAARRGQGVTAIEDVSFSLADREVVALIGPSGCGKSTLLNIGAGLYRPSAGEALVDGE